MNCLIVDDDVITAELIAEFARRENLFHDVHTCDNPVVALSMLEQGNYEALFLDIEMPDMNGLELLQTLKQPVLCVLITSKTEHALEAFEYGVIDYLVKPVRFHRFHTAVQKLQEFLKVRIHTEPNDDSVFIKAGRQQFIKIQLSKILYLEAQSDYVIFYMEGGQQHIVLTTMKSMASKLPSNFLRIHRSYLVNFHKIDSIEDDSVTIQKKSIPLSSSCKTLLLKHLKML